MQPISRVSYAFTILAIALLIGASVAAFSTIQGDRGVSCGSWISRDNAEAKNKDLSDELFGYGSSGTVVESCKEAMSNRTPVVAALGVLAIGCVIAAVGTSNRRRPTALPADGA